VSSPHADLESSDCGEVALPTRLRLVRNRRRLLPTIAEILERKGRDVASLATSESVLAAAHLMNERGIGGILVTQDFDVVGVFTERDVMRRVVADRRDPATTSLQDVMTTPVITLPPDTSIEDCIAIMTHRRVRHIPVVGPDGLVGIVTSGDVMAHQVKDREETIEHLVDYITTAPKWSQAKSEPGTNPPTGRTTPNPHQLL
jgi:CBS domain-containing protein